MSEKENRPQPRSLHLQTIESLFADLIGGIGISVEDGAPEFRLDSSDSRSVLNWYRINRSKWAGNVMALDVEAMVSAMLSTPPPLPVPELTAPKAGRRLSLAKVVAHRFAGVHAYGTPDAPPPDFVFEPREPITLFEGWNGAGKTSILNAIIWCMTGEILRPQREPERGQQEFDGQFVQTIDGVDQTTSHALTPVTPLPNPAAYVPPANKPVPVDTWVELTFKDQDGNILPPVRRTQMRTANLKISENMSGLESLGVDPIALRIGSIMPALLQFLRVGATSDLGLAAAKLTGLADIASLAKHAATARTKLKGELKKRREGELAEADAHFLEARSDLQKQIDEYPQMAPPDVLPVPSATRELERSLETLQQHFEGLKGSALSAAKTILGTGFDPTAKAARDNLEASIGPAQGQLKLISQLPNARRLRALSEIAENDWQHVDDLIAQLRTEAMALAELAKTPELERRKQLYARVAGWMAETKGHDPSSCAVCSRSLEGVVDPVTRREVTTHLEEVTEAERQLLAFTQRNWAATWASKLIAKCPTALRTEISSDLPAHPRDLVHGALVDDLFGTPAFEGVLAHLKNGAGLLCDRELARLPTFIEPIIEPLPVELNSISGPLVLSIRRLVRARAFVQWRATHLAELGAAHKAILQGSGQNDEDITDLTPVGRKLDALASIVKGATPLNSALSLCQRLIAHLKIRRSKEDLLGRYDRAVHALERIVELGSLAERQVDGLRKRLHVGAAHWRDRCYQNAYPMAGHALRDTAMDVKGVLDIQVGFEKATAPAQHISNVSALRASLMGFFLAFWEHVLETRGGIALLIFDDPQELLDHDNKTKLASLLPELAKKGGQILVATYDRHFARELVAAARQFSAIEHRSVHPVNPTRSRLETAAATEELERKHSAYEADKDSAVLAQDYANEVRIFLEARLGDLFDDPAYPAYSAASKAPTLWDFIVRLQGLVNKPPNALFRGKAVREFSSCKALTSGAQCRIVLNTAHHKKASLSAGDVYAVAGELQLLRKLAEKMHSEFRLWRWHEPLETEKAPGNIVQFTPTNAPGFKVLIQPDLAAFAGSMPNVTQDVASDVLDETWFANKALFLIRTNNLGFSVPAGCIAIAESDPYNGKDHNLVIARQKGHLLARRLLRSASGHELMLAAEAPDPRQSTQTLMFSAGGVAVHRIVGMLAEQPAPPHGKGEAMELPTASSLSDIKSAYRVREESAIPLALPGQVVLGGDFITRDRLVASEGVLVALVLSDGSSAFKRVGKSVPGTDGRLWQFESVGGLGASLVVTLEDPDEPDTRKREVAIFVCARRIVGVLYDV
ncbi:MAG: ATP-binding protein [Micropepsaceae bacterium]